MRRRDNHIKMSFELVPPIDDQSVGVDVMDGPRSIALPNTPLLLLLLLKIVKMQQDGGSLSELQSHYDVDKF